MSETLVTLERRDDGVAVIRLDRPKANALSAELLSQISELVADLAADLPGAVVIWGGPRIFAAGADIAEFGDSARSAQVAVRFRETLDAIAALPRISIAAVCGYALGGGCELAMACDFRVIGDTAKLGQPEILLGIIPGGGGTQRLPRLVGHSRAKDLSVTGRQVDAEEALRIGLADRVVPADQVFDQAVTWAAQLAAGPLLAQAAVKQAIERGQDLALPAGLDLEAELFVPLFDTEDARVGIRSFLEQGPGKARFHGR
jgi:enoyl-CoA hydratase/carnithine racemase